MKHKNIPIGVITLIILWSWSVIITDKYVSTTPTDSGSLTHTLHDTPHNKKTSHDKPSDHSPETFPDIK